MARVSDSRLSNAKPLSYVIRNLAVCSGGYLCTNKLCTLIAVWLDIYASQISRNCVQLNRSDSDMHFGIYDI